MSKAKAEPRPFLGILFRCCAVYGRVYQNQDATAYTGGCPKCRGPIRIAIDPSRGTGARFFEYNR